MKLILLERVQTISSSWKIFKEQVSTVPKLNIYLILAKLWNFHRYEICILCMIDDLHESQFDICFSLHINEPFTLYVTGSSKKIESKWHLNEVFIYGGCRFKLLSLCEKRRLPHPPFWEILKYLRGRDGERERKREYRYKQKFFV